MCENEQRNAFAPQPIHLDSILCAGHVLRCRSVESVTEQRAKPVHGRYENGVVWGKAETLRCLALSLHLHFVMSSTPFAGLGSKVKTAYSNAVKSGAVLFTESQIEEADDEETGIPVSFESLCSPRLKLTTRIHSLKSASLLHCRRSQLP